MANGRLKEQIALSPHDGRKPLPTGIASSKQLKTLTKELDDYCAAHGISEGPDRDEIGRLVLYLFNSGHRTAEEIKLALEKTDEWRALRRG